MAVIDASAGTPIRFKGQILWVVRFVRRERGLCAGICRRPRFYWVSVFGNRRHPSSPDGLGSESSPMLTGLLIRSRSPSQPPSETQAGFPTPRPQRRGSSAVLARSAAPGALVAPARVRAEGSGQPLVLTATHLLPEIAIAKAVDEVTQKAGVQARRCDI